MFVCVCVRVWVWARLTPCCCCFSLKWYSNCFPNPPHLPLPFSCASVGCPELGQALLDRPECPPTSSTGQWYVCLSSHYFGHILVLAIITMTQGGNLTLGKQLIQHKSSGRPLHCSAPRMSRLKNNHGTMGGLFSSWIIKLYRKTQLPSAWRSLSAPFSFMWV